MVPVRIIIGVAILASFVSGHPAHAAEEVAGNELKALLDLRIIDQVLRVYADEAGPVEGPTGWSTLSTYAKKLPAPYRTRLPDRDPWGSDYRICPAGDEILVSSSGPDGKAAILEPGQQAPEEAPEASRDSAQQDTSEPLCNGFATSIEVKRSDDYVLVVGHGVVKGPRTLRERQRTAMADLRTIGTAVETYSIDTNVYPLQIAGLREVATIAGDLQPVYIREVPLLDPWGNPFLYWSNQEQYIIVSTGADGILGRDVVELVLISDPWDKTQFGGTTDREADILFVNGQFKQWPKGSQL